MLKDARVPRFAILVVSLAVAVTGCDPGGTPGAQQQQALGEPAAPKVLTIAVARFVNVLQRRVVGAAAGAGEPDIFQIAHEDLAVLNAGVPHPRLATEMPTIEKGTWQVNPDGTMDVTWKLRPNIKWHDGGPYTSADHTFGFQVYKDPELPSETQGRQLQFIKSVSAPDPLTFVVHWSQTHVEGDTVSGLHPMPRHLLEDTYRTNKQSLDGHPAWNSQFTGLGPYKVDRWQDGYQVDFVRFDSYWQGRPPLDRVIVRVIPDSNTMVANIMAGEIDVILPVSLSLDAAAELKTRWEGTGNQVHTFLDEPNLKVLDIQRRVETARPQNGLTNFTVRQGMYQAINRDAIAEVMTHGLAPRADSWFAPNDPSYPEVEATIPRYPYDPARARALLAEAGWIPGPDGVLIDRATGERFGIEIRGEPAFVKEMPIVADNWRAIGTDPFLHAIPAALAGDREQKVLTSGVAFTQAAYTAFPGGRLHMGRIPTRENRFSGTNSGGYSNPTSDAIVDRLVSTIEPRERLALHKDLLREHLGDIPAMLLYFSPQTVEALNGVMGITGKATWNFFEWKKQ